MDEARPACASGLHRTAGHEGQEARLEALNKETSRRPSPTRTLKRSATLRDEKKKLQNEMTERRKAWEQHRDEKVETVGEEEIAGIVSMWTGIPSPA